MKKVQGLQLQQQQPREQSVNKILISEEKEDFQDIEEATPTKQEEGLQEEYDN